VPIITQALRSSFSSSVPTNLTSTSVTHQAIARVRSDQDLPLELLCRICEELVPADQLEAHSKTCAINSMNDMKASSCDDKLLKVCSTNVLLFNYSVYQSFGEKRN
jgi:hypothetical protein